VLNHGVEPAFPACGVPDGLSGFADTPGCRQGLGDHKSALGVVAPERTSGRASTPTGGRSDLPWGPARVVCLTGVGCCACPLLVATVAAGQRLSGTTHTCGVSGHRQGPKPQGSGLVVCWGWYVRGGVQGECAQEFAVGDVDDGDAQVVGRGDDGSAAERIEDRCVGGGKPFAPQVPDSDRRAASQVLEAARCFRRAVLSRS
jgi:hypothetical protein